ncbi:MAG: YbhB/YbcL family Raf kinase inhibitor-like protein [Candidatus Bathyarchaeum sp.]|nr:MAG: YbhB/YbcL family Raf kinase inhibitor-like protein [Candidatus Bathyarchaeum sp.]
MKLLSKDFEDTKNIPSEFTCDGRNVSPQLSWEDVPANTKSFALGVTDPDAPGGMWIHWLVYDISKALREIEQNSLPAGAKEVENDFGKKPYGGPCPPSGTHRYIFVIYALDVEHLEGIKKHNFLNKVEEHTIEKAVIKGLYKRR